MSKDENTIVFPGTQKRLALDILRCQELLEKKSRSAGEELDFDRLMAIVFQAAEAMATDSDLLQPWIEKANREAGFEPRSTDELLAREAIAGIGNSTWHRIVRSEYLKYKNK